MTNNKYFVVRIVDTWKFASNKLTERSSICSKRTQCKTLERKKIF